MHVRRGNKREGRAHEQWCVPTLTGLTRHALCSLATLLVMVAENNCVRRSRGMAYTSQQQNTTDCQTLHSSSPSLASDLHECMSAAAQGRDARNTYMPPQQHQTLPYN